MEPHESPINTKAVATFAAIVAVALLALVIVKAFNISYPLHITTSAVSSELSVVGDGKVEVVPDTAVVNMGVTIDNASTVSEAQSRMDTVNNAIVESMKALGISKENIRTSNYSIYPSYSSGTPNPRISGYSGNVSINITTKKTEQVSEILTKATEAGANQVQGVSFSIDNPDKFREEARTQAINNAKEQAKKLADDLGIKLGRITNIVESSDGAVYPLMQKSADFSRPQSGGGGPEIEPGSETVYSTVTLFFEKR